MSQNTNHKKVFTSSMNKIYNNLDRIVEFQKTGVLRPITLNFSPTNNCNLNCSFCSVKNRDKSQELDWDTAVAYLDFFADRGIKTLKFTGGGEPTVWEHFDKFVIYSKNKFPHIKLSLITNGMNLQNHPLELISSFDWIRISLNAFDQGKEPMVPLFHTTLISFSYVYNKSTTPEVIRKLEELLWAFPTTILKVQMDVFDESLKISKELMELMSGEFDSRVFLNQKVTKFVNPECFMGWVKPLVNPDGKIYRCSCNALTDKKYNGEFEIEDYTITPDIFDTSICDFCYFGEQNKFIDDIYKNRNLKHGDFI